MIFLRNVFWVFPVLAGGLALGQARADAPGEVRFGVHVRPILSHNCMQCHGPDENHRKAKLRLDVESGLFGGSGDERIVVPGADSYVAQVERFGAELLAFLADRD